MMKIRSTFLSVLLVICEGHADAQASTFHDNSPDPVVIAAIEILALLGILYFLLPKAPKGEPATKRKSYVGLIVFGFVLLAMMTTNPSLEDHRQAVMDELEKKVTESGTDRHSDDWEKIAASIGQSIGKIVLDRVVTRENYLLFSITTVQVGDAKKDIGFGIFGKVWVYRHLNGA